MKLPMWTARSRKPQSPPPENGQGAYLRLADGSWVKASIDDILALRSRAFGDLNVGAEWADPKYGEYPAVSSAAYRAITARMSAVRSAPLVVHRATAEGLTPVGEDHPVQRLLDYVNPWWTSADLLSATEMYLCIWGSAFWLLDQSAPSAPTIWPLRPDKVRIVPGKRGQDYITGYQYDEGGKKIPLLPEEVVWFRYINPLDEFAGLSPIAAGRLSLDMGRNALKFNSAFFKQGVNPGDLVFISNSPMTDEQVEEFYERLDKRFKGPTAAHRPLITEDGSVMKLGINNRDMEFINSLEYTVEEAARIWGVPPPVLMSQKASTYNNTKEAWIHFYVSTISEEWSFLEMEINEMLLPLLREQGLKVTFDRSNVLPLQEARTAIDTADLAKVQAGCLTINEYRAARNLEPVEWGDEWNRMAPVLGAEAVPTRRSLKATEAIEEKAVRNHGSRLDSAGRHFAAEQRALFNQQRADALLKLKAIPETGIKQVEGGKVDLNGKLIFDPADWSVPYTRTGTQLITQILAGAANGQAAEFGLGAFDARKQSVSQWVADRTSFWEQRVNSETAKLLAEELADGVEAGESIRDLQKRVEKVFKFNNEVRSEMIARTESLTAANQGHLEVYRQSGVVDEKMWLATLDGRERPEHHEANRQVVALDAKFSVGGEALDAPGLGGSAGNVINCRCTVVPIVRRRKERSAESLAGLNGQHSS